MKVVEDREKVNMESMPLTIREGVVVPRGEFLETFADGEFARVPIILGTNRDESKLFLMNDPEYTWNLFGVLPRIRNAARYERDAGYGSLVWKADGADLLAIEIERREDVDVYGYRFDWDEEPPILGSDLSALIGAAHGVEIPFVMGAPALGPLMRALGGEKTEASRRPLSDAMGAYWSQFARTGSPNGEPNEDLPEWTPWNSSTEEAPRFMIFDSKAGGWLRMSADYQTPERIAKRVRNDERFESEEERCLALANLAESFPRYAASNPASGDCL